MRKSILSTFVIAAFLTAVSSARQKHCFPRLYLESAGHSVAPDPAAALTATVDAQNPFDRPDCWPALHN